MTLPTIEQARRWRGLTLAAIDEQPLGEIEAIYVDSSSRQPAWALVQTGLFGGALTFVPLADAAELGGIVQVPHETSVVHEAPRLAPGAKLTGEDEARLYAHYGISSTTGRPPSSRLEPDAPARAARTAARTAVEAGQQAAASGRLAIDKARQEVAAVVAAIETTPESKRTARRRARARKRVMAAAAGAVRPVARVLKAAWHRLALILDKLRHLI